MIELLSVNVALPSVLGLYRGQPIKSGIRKSPVTTTDVAVSTVNIAGDAQADLRVHGGPEKAIFAYPSEHLEGWANEFGDGSPLPYGLIGDNLTMAGVDETQAHIGDIWQWGSVRLQICQPRFPCFKLGMTVGNHRILRRFMETGWSGWYLRVLTEGIAPVAGPIGIEAIDPAGITVREAAFAAYGPYDQQRQLDIAGHPALAASWRYSLLDRAGAGS
jgi:MOSC domain-containing protein YiiM